MRTVYIFLFFICICLQQQLLAASELDDSALDEDFSGGDEDYPPDGDYPSEYDDEATPPPQPASEPITSLEELDAFIDNEDCSVIGAFASEDGDEYAEFEAAIQSLQYEWRFAHTTAPEVLTKLKVSKSALFLYRSPRYVSEKYGDRKRDRFPSSKISGSALKSWLQTRAQPLVGQFTPSTKERYFAKKLPVVIVFFNLNWEGDAKGANYFLNRVRKVATSMSGKLSFAIAAIGDFEAQLGDFGLEASDLRHDVRIGLVHKEGDEEVYYGSDATKFSAEVLSGFASAFLANELSPSSRRDTSAPAEDDDGVDESAVTTLTNDNFDQVVRDPTKDVLVEFYAPWCGHCKSLKPEYAKAAKALKGEKSLVLAKMDATAHDPPAGFDVQGYPTLLFVPAKADASPVPYEGEREADAIVEWMKENALSLR